MYYEIRPGRELQRYIDAFWYVLSDSSKTVTSRIVPDGYSDIIFRHDYLTENRSEFTVAGQMTRERVVDIEAGQQYVGVRFKPGALFPILGSSMHEFTDENYSLDLVDKKLFGNLIGDMVNLKCPKDKITVLSNAIGRELALKDKTDPLVEYVSGMIISSGGNVTAGEISRKSGYSIRHIQRLFKRNVGISPKMLGRIVRFKKIDKIIKNSSPKNYHSAIFDSGYFDQSHFIREYKTFTGVTPTEMSYFYNTGG